MPGAEMVVNPYTSGNPAMSYGVPKGIKQDSDRVPVVVRLRQVGACPVSCLLPTYSSDVSTIQSGEVLKGCAAGSERRKVGMRDSWSGLCSDSGKADSDVFLKPCKPTLKEPARKSRIAAHGASVSRRPHQTRPEIRSVVTAPLRN
jgi:hypothetical protein